MEEARGRREVVAGARRQWSSLLQAVSSGQVRCCVAPSGGQGEDGGALSWKKTLLDVSSRKQRLGLSLVRSHFGAMILNLSPDSPLQFLGSILLGAVLVEVDDVNVVLETYESITKRLDSIFLERGVLLRFLLNNNRLFDVLLTPPLTKSGIVWGPCSDLAQVKNVDSLSRAQHSGVEVGDIIISLQKHFGPSSASPVVGTKRIGKKAQSGSHCIELSHLTFSKTCSLLERSDRYRTSVQLLGSRMSGRRNKLNIKQSHNHAIKTTTGRTLSNVSSWASLSSFLVTPSQSPSSLESSTPHLTSQSYVENSPFTLSTCPLELSPPLSATSPLMGTALIEAASSYDSLTSLGISESSFALSTNPRVYSGESFHMRPDGSRNILGISPMHKQESNKVQLSVVFGSLLHWNDSVLNSGNGASFFDEDTLSALQMSPSGQNFDMKRNSEAFDLLLSWGYLDALYMLVTSLLHNISRRRPPNDFDVLSFWLPQLASACTQPPPASNSLFKFSSTGAHSTLTLLLRCFESQQIRSRASLEDWFCAELGLLKQATAQLSAKDSAVRKHEIPTLSSFSPSDKMQGVQLLVCLCNNSVHNKLLLCRLYWNVMSCIVHFPTDIKTSSSPLNMVDIYYTTFFEKKCTSANPKIDETIGSVRTPYSEKRRRPDSDAGPKNRWEEDAFSLQSEASKDLLMMVLHLTNKTHMDDNACEDQKCRLLHDELSRQHRFLFCIKESVQNLSRRRKSKSDDRVNAALNMIREQKALKEMKENGVNHVDDPAGFDKKSINFQEFMASQLEKDDALHSNDPLFPLMFPVLTSQSQNYAEYIEAVSLTECRVLKSAQYPVLVVLEVKNISLSEDYDKDPFLPSSDSLSTASNEENASSQPFTEFSSLYGKSNGCSNRCNSVCRKKKSFLFKMEDDLRQDAIVLQIFKYLDEAFKKAGFDLNLVFYDILPTGPREGFVEWVDGAIPLSKIIKDFATTTQVLRKANLAAKNASLAAKTGRSNVTINNDVGIAFLRGSRSSTTRAVKRLSSAAARDYENHLQPGIALKEFSSDDAVCDSENISHKANGMSIADNFGTSDNVLASPPNSKKNIDSPIHNFFRAHFPSSSFYDLFGVESSIMHTFVNTAAGSCVLTYVLGIGDRHLDNILLLPTGHLLHVDFGYSFGKDPKHAYLRSQMRFTKEMYDAMGGDEDAYYYLQFKKTLANAFLVARKHAASLLCFFRTLLLAGVADLRDSRSIEDAIKGVQIRLQLHLSPEQACQFITSLASESAQAFVPQMMDRVHQVANYFR